jgi:hypothetical protein
MLVVHPAEQTPGNATVALNMRIPANAVTPGSYPSSVYTNSALGVAGFNQIMMQQAENFDPFIQISLISQPRFWHDRIPRGAFPNFEGYEKETRIFRGGLTEYAGIGAWKAIDPNPTTLNNPCATGPYATMKYAWERLQWSGFSRRWGSDPICSESLRFVNQVTQQLAWTLQAGAEYGVSIQEVWNRDWLLKTSVDHDRSFIMTTTYVGNTSAPRFFYEPRCKFLADAAAVAADTAAQGVAAPYPIRADLTGITGPFIVLPATVEVEPLNFDVLDALHESLDVRCPGSAIGNDSGRPVYGLPISALDFERYIKGNAYEVANWRESRSEKLITGYDLGVKTHRAWGILNDGNQLRFRIVKRIASYDATNYAGVGADLNGTAVYIAQYVAPRIDGRLGENGVAIPEDNPEYFTAELAVMPILMNNVFTNLFGTPLTSLGSGTFFGPQAGLNGKWSWVNIPGVNNEEGTIGNFRGKFEIFPKPETSVVHSTSFLYRRCTESIHSRAPIDNATIDPESATGAIVVKAAVGSGADATADTALFSITLADKLADGAPGSAVTLAFTGEGATTNPAFTGYLLKTASAPTYTVLASLADVGVAVLEAGDVTSAATGYYLNAAGGLVYHVTSASTVALALSTVTLVG